MKLPFLLSSPSSRRVQPSQIRTIEGAGEDAVIYAVGDVHGCFTQMRQLEDRIMDHAQRKGDRLTQIVYLGDLIDRGPQSSRVLDYILTKAPGIERHCIAGNHERAMLRFLDSPNTFSDWLAIGGSETLRSYGVGIPRRATSRAALHEIACEARASIPDNHIQFLRALPLALLWGRYVFVHAGVRPGVPLERQNPTDLLGIREPFFETTEQLSSIVVHGHTAVGYPEQVSNRISLDTGCYATGRLSAARLFGDSVTFVTVSSGTA